MSSASNGRKNRPRSAGNIFQIGKPPYRDPQRRESTESTRKAQRAVADCRMVGLRHVSAGMVPKIRSAILLYQALFVLGQSTIPRMQDAQATAVNSCKKKECNPVWEPKNSCMHLHCFVGSETKQITSSCRLTLWFAFGVLQGCCWCWAHFKIAWITRLFTVFRDRCTKVLCFGRCWQEWSYCMSSLLHHFIHQHVTEPRIENTSKVHELHKINDIFMLQYQADNQS